jgi:hypothetical protein
MAIVKSLGLGNDFAAELGSKTESSLPRSTSHTDYGWTAAAGSPQVIRFRTFTLPTAPNDSPDDPLDDGPDEPPLAA